MGVNVGSLMRSIIAGQVLSLFLSGTNIFISILNNSGISSCLYPTELVYHVLLVLLLPLLPRIIHLYRTLPRSTHLLYALLGIVDFAANCAVIYSFSWTSAVSVMLISSTSAIFAMLLAILVFKRRYQHLHYAGACVVLMGLGIINYSKYTDEDGNGWQGNVLALCAAIGYALSNTLNEYVARRERGYPYGACMGMALWASLFSTVLVNMTGFGRADRDLLLFAETPSKWFIIGFIICMCAIYLLIPLYLQTYSAVRFNFNILTADLMVLLFHWLNGGPAISLIYMMGFVTIFVGMVIFNVHEPVDHSTATIESIHLATGTIWPTKVSSSCSSASV